MLALHTAQHERLAGVPLRCARYAMSFFMPLFMPRFLPAAAAVAAALQEAMEALDAKEQELVELTKQVKESREAVQQSQAAIDLGRSRADQEAAELRERLAAQAAALESMKEELVAAKAAAEDLEHVRRHAWLLCLSLCCLEGADA